MKIKRGDQLFPYCKSECLQRKNGTCAGMRLKDTPVFELLEKDPILATIVGEFHATDPPCGHYHEYSERVKFYDERGDEEVPRKRKLTKPKPKRKICRCKK